VAFADFADFELGVKENSGIDATGLGDLRKSAGRRSEWTGTLISSLLSVSHSLVREWMETCRAAKGMAEWKIVDICFRGCVGLGGKARRGALARKLSRRREEQRGREKIEKQTFTGSSKQAAPARFS
jgi:hypothetical protein